MVEVVLVRVRRDNLVGSRVLNLCDVLVGVIVSRTELAMKETWGKRARLENVREVRFCFATMNMYHQDKRPFIVDDDALLLFSSKSLRYPATAIPLVR